jgi:hypothetical protein
VHPTPILRFLADLAASTAAGSSPAVPEGATPETLDLTRTQEPPAWLGTSVVLPLELPGGQPDTRGGRRSVRRTDAVRHLAALDALQPAEHLLRLGWVVVAGRVTVEDRTVTYCFPLLSQPVRLAPPTLRRVTVLPAGAPELTPLVQDPETAGRLEAGATYGGGALDPMGGSDDHGAELIARLPRLQAWIRSVVEAAGLPPLRAVLPPSADPVGHRRDDGLVAVVGAMLYVARDVFRPSAEGALRSWATRDGIQETAFARLYERGADPAPEPRDDRPVCTPLRLSPAQTEAVHRARHEPISVISGPPGSGKSHTVAAIAADAVAHGGSVLIATRSEHAADVVAGLLVRQAGPDPVRFGGAQNDDIVRQSTARGTSAGDVESAQRILDEARAHQQLAERAVTAMLEREQAAARAPTWDGLVGELSATAPGAFDPASALDDLAARLERCAAGAGGSWWARWRAGRAERRLRHDLRAPAGTPLADLRTALRCAADRRAAAELATSGGTVIAPAWRQLLAADEAVRHAAGGLAEVEAAREDRRREGRGAANDLATALRAGRRQRRRLLRLLDGERIVRALPLWVGTLRDVEDLLPDTPGLFDLVILDEASQIDQIAAAGSLLRARRAVVVGDPRQLRHVSFLSDALIERTMAAHRLASVAARLDVRRASVLDVAAGAAPTTWLDEHFRSVPHLIDFSARRFYEGRLFLATRHPANEATDAIDVIRVPSGEGTAELDAALATVARLADRGLTDVALVSPFRELADAAQTALLATYDVEDVQRLGLRVGTVHAFQGAEADHVVLLLGVSPDDGATRRRFVEDPHLFNVMVTRARRSLTVVTSLPPEDAGSSSGLIEQYLAHAGRPPAPPGGARSSMPWADALARELAAVGTPVRAGYPVGRWTVDLCIGTEDAAAVDTGVHPDGPAAHIARHRLLVTAGWRHADGYPTRWDGDPTRAALELGTYR